jgi:DNA-binding NtrC family response regulator
MGSRAEVLVCACRGDDLAVLKKAAGCIGSILRIVENPLELARCAGTSRAVAILLGVGRSNLEHLEMIPVIHAVRSDLPIIVLAEEDSLELERAARQKKIFYYLVHPLDSSEVKAVLEDVLRYPSS